MGEKIPNDWGLFDIHGNVWECCHDWYGGYKTEQVLIDPKGAVSGSKRVLRGGAFSVHSKNVRSAYRFSFQPDNRIAYIGFRLARTYNLSP